jgi:hypothetical protein
MADIKNHSTLPTSLVSYWDLEEASGTRYDLVGSNDLTENGTGGVGQAAGKTYGNGADLEAGESDYLNITDGDQTGLDITGDFSISMWVKPETLVDQYTIAARWSGGVGDSFLIRYQTAGNFQMFNRLSGSTSSTTVSYTMSTATWYHLVFLYDASAGSFQVYVNGTSQGTGTGLETSMDNATVPFSFGAVKTDATPDKFFDGVIDEAGMWSKVLTSDEISDLYNAGSGLQYYDPTDIKNDTDLSTSLLSYWEMEDAADANRLDSVASNTLIDNGGVGRATGKVGDYAGDFIRANNEYFSLADHADFDVTTSVNRSCFAWVKTTVATSSPAIVAKWGSTQRNFLLRIETDGIPKVFAGSGASTGVSIKASTAVDDGNWHHVGFVWDSSDDKWRIYVDGVLEGTSATAAPAASTADLGVGAQDGAGSTGSSEMWDGEIDEVAWYQKVVPVDQVRALYGYGTPPVYEVAVASTNTTNFFQLI